MAGRLQWFVSIGDPVANLHQFPRHMISSSDNRALRSEAMHVVREIVELGMAPECPKQAPGLRTAVNRLRNLIP